MNNLIKNKKALELAINTIVILVLAILLLAFLVLFFTETGKNFLGKTRGYTSEVNVDEVVKGCNILADTNKEYSYCCEKKGVIYYKEGEKIEKQSSCLELGKLDIGNKIKELNCNIEC